MIRANTGGFAALAAQLTRRARALALSLSENDLRERQQDPRRWRNARLLWPAVHEEP